MTPPGEGGRGLILGKSLFQTLSKLGPFKGEQLEAYLVSPPTAPPSALSTGSEQFILFQLFKYPEIKSAPGLPCGLSLEYAWIWDRGLGSDGSAEIWALAQMEPQMNPQTSRGGPRVLPGVWPYLGSNGGWGQARSRTILQAEPRINQGGQAWFCLPEKLHPILSAWQKICPRLLVEGELGPILKSTKPASLAIPAL